MLDPQDVEGFWPCSLSLCVQELGGVPAPVGAPGGQVKGPMGHVLGLDIYRGTPAFSPFPLQLLQRLPHIPRAVSECVMILIGRKRFPKATSEGWER